MSGPLKTESGYAERVRHEEIDFLELAEVIGTRFELDLEALPKWQEVRKSGHVWKWNTPRLSCIPSQMHPALFICGTKPSPP